MEKKEKAGLKYKLDFGKHKGKSLGDVIQTDPSYVSWCINKGILRLTKKAKNHLEYIYRAKAGIVNCGEMVHGHRLMEPYYSEEDRRTYYEREIQGTRVMASYNDDGTSTIYFGGPCGPMEFDENGEMM